MPEKLVVVTTVWLLADMLKLNIAIFNTVQLIIIIIISGVFAPHLHKAELAKHYKVWIKWTKNKS